MRCDWRFAAILLALAAQGCANGVATPDRFDERTAASRPPGYLPPASLGIVASAVRPPPAPGSAAQAADDEAYRASQRLRGTPRWEWAAHDADVAFPNAVDRFSCAVGLPITRDGTPNLYLLLRRSFIDVGLAAYQAKAPFERTRPFVAKDDPICTPQSAPAFRKDSSYPSAAAATGWAWALVLSELFPERQATIIERGYELGESRAVCGVHWASDVAAGRLAGAAMVAQLHGNEEFREQLAQARREVAGARSAGLKPTVDCDAERRALGMRVKEK